MRLEEHRAVHRRVDTIGGKFFHVDAVLREHAGNLMEDAGAILADEFNGGDGAAGGGGEAEFLAGRDLQTAFFEPCERGDQRIAFFCGYFDTDDAGKLSAEATHAAFEPVAAMFDDMRGDEFDEAGAIRTDHGHNEGGKHGAMLHSRAACVRENLLRVNCKTGSGLAAQSQRCILASVLPRMNLPKFAYTVLLVFFVLLLPTVSGAAEHKKMNVLFIISDDLRAELACYGDTPVKTPTLDRLAAKGVRFERAYCQYPLCCPSRTSMLTGRNPTTSGVQGNRTWFGTAHPDWVSLPKYFRQHGYLTLRSGKIFHEGLDDTDAWVEGGEARYFGDGVPAPKKENPAAAKPSTAAEDEAHVKNMVAQDRSHAAKSDRWVATPDDEDPPQSDTVKTDKALELLRKAATADKPFFLAFGLSKPHSPLIAPKRFFEQYNVDDMPLPVDFALRPTVPEGFPAGSIRPNNADLFVARDATPKEAREMIRAYLACVSYVDWNVSRVLDELKKLGLAENTIVVFWGDNGYQLGEKGKWSKAGSLWEQGARIPLMIYDPRVKGNGRSSPRIVQALDIYPTLVDLCDLPKVDGLEGLSLRSLLDDPQATWDHPAYCIWNEHARGITGVVVRTERWRYAEFYGRGAGAMLIDPIEDPHELKNLANDPQYAPVVKELSALAKKYVGDQAEPAAKD